MTTKPQLKLGSHLVPGLAAVVLFLVMAVVFLGTSFGEAAGFAQQASITSSIGYAMFGIDPSASSGTLVGAENFLVAFEIIDIVLVAALAGAVMLARREQGGRSVTALMTDGGESGETEGDD